MSLIVSALGKLLSIVTFNPEGPADWGAYYTPTLTAKMMVRLSQPSKTDKILEPSAGNGVFIKALLEYGVKPKQITALEIDPDICLFLQKKFPGVKVENKDALLDEIEDQFDLIIGNPPYLSKQSSYVRHHRAALASKYASKIGSSETYAMFCSMAIDHLKDKGRLAFLVSDTVRTLTSHERLRQQILRQAPLTHLIRTPVNLFPDLAIKTVVLICQRGSSQSQVLTLEAESEGDYKNNFNSLPLSSLSEIDGCPFLFEIPSFALALFSQPGRLFDYVSGHIGMHTRDNKRYLAALSGTPLAESYQRRRKEKGTFRVISDKEAQSASWRPYLKRGGKQDFYSFPSEFIDWSPSARKNYIIPANNIFGQEGLAVSGVSSRLSVRVMPAHSRFDSNKVIGLVPGNSADQFWLLGLLSSDLYNYLTKKMINETSSLQLSSLQKIPVPDLSANDKDRLSDLAKECVLATKENREVPLDRLNRLVEDIFALSPEDIKIIR